MSQNNLTDVDFSCIINYILITDFPKNMDRYLKKYIYIYI